MDKTVLLSPITLDELKNSFREVVKGELRDSAIRATKQEETISEELLTAKDVAKMIGVSLVTVHKWKKSGILKFQRYGTRIRFKKSDVLQTKNRRAER